MEVCGLMLGKSSKLEEGKECRFWDCDRGTGYTWCYEHYGAFKKGEVDLCPGCGKGKWLKFGVCGRCRGQEVGGDERSRVDSNRAEEVAEIAERPVFGGVAVYFVYLLSVDGKGWYAEYSDDVDERLREHRSGRVRFTAGRGVELRWFGMVPTREQAVELQGQLRLIGERDPRELDGWVEVFGRVQKGMRR